MKKTYSALVGLFLLSAFGTNAYAAACTYDEAILALQQGNALRGLALIRMAARDGDIRATHYLTSRPLLDVPQSVRIAQNSKIIPNKNNNLIAYRENK